MVCFTYFKMKKFGGQLLIMTGIGSGVFEADQNWCAMSFLFWWDGQGEYLKKRKEKEKEKEKEKKRKEVKGKEKKEMKKRKRKNEI